LTSQDRLRALGRALVDGPATNAGSSFARVQVSMLRAGASRCAVTHLCRGRWGCPRRPLKRARGGDPRV